MNQLVSVIITTYKRSPDMLRRAVDSVLNQTYPDIELIVVDDSPASYPHRDAVAQSVASWDSNIVYIQHAVNQGACAARNTGAKIAKGDFFAFLDDDDAWVETKIQKQMDALLRDQAGFVYCGQTIIHEVQQKTFVPSNVYLTGMIYEQLILDNFVGSTSFVLMQKELFEQAGGFDIQAKSSQDHDLWLRLAKLVPATCVKEPLVNYYIHSDDCISANPANKVQGTALVIQKNWDYIQTNPVAIASVNAKIAPWYMRNKQYKQSFHSLWTAFQKNPRAVSCWGICGLRVGKHLAKNIVQAIKPSRS